MELRTLLLLLLYEILRSIFGPKKEDGIWKTRTNKELTELNNNPDTVPDFRSRRIACIIKNYLATSHVNCLKGENPNVSRTISVLVFTVLM
jgi:hypothetical protein